MSQAVIPERQARFPIVSGGAYRRVKNLLSPAALAWAKVLWVLVPLLVLLFTFAAGRGWPLSVESNFPRVGKSPARPVATAATLFVYTPAARTLRLAATFQVDEPGRRPPLQVSVSHGAEIETSVVGTRPTGDGGLIEAAAPLRLTPGTNAVRLTLGGAAPTPTAFFVKSARVTRSIFNAGNLLFGVTLAAVAAASILAAQALGVNGLSLFCAASQIGFLLLTTTATLLSPFRLLTGEAWASGLIASSLALGAAAALRPRRHPAPAATPENTLRPLEAFVLLAVACPVFVMHILSPITRWDDLMYHGSRAGYWMQNASALPFVSHNDRLSVFPMGGDLLFACGAIISGSEMPGKFLVGLALPLTLFAMLALLRNAGVRSSAALGIGVIFATTPLVFFNAVGIKPDLWLVLLGIITLHWVLTAWRGGGGISPATVSCLAAAGAGAAFGIKWTAAPLLLLAPFALLLPGWRQHPARRLLPPTAAFTLALALGGAGPILLYNLRVSQHPFGPKAMRAWHQPDPGLHPMVVQLARLPFILFPPPFVPSESIRQSLESWETAAAEKIGATEQLWRETGSDWPGRFQPRVKQMDDEFSLGWVFSVVGVAAGLYLFRRGADCGKRAAMLLSAGLSLVFVLAVATQTRWQVKAGLPDRFLLPALAFGLLAAAWPADRLLARGRLTAAGLCALLGLHALFYGRLAVMPFQLGAGSGWQAPTASGNSSEVSTISRQLPPGRTILLFADQSCQDYPLFLASDGFANRVLPWGKAAYAPAAFAQALHQPGVDTVIFVSPDSIDMIWEPPLDARPFIEEMNSRADFGLMPGTGKLVVFRRKL